ncbi:class I SAM-dependent methyltransferase [Roseivivax sediminis]|uniref:class I SAM-dependent methyltransferase n=1 Tax=Roseivivax sediminis TaxID=936889 RepID=UPI001CB7365C|nr:class I SAM-dependent methyltransferase [Roseivivax sediminis]
MTAIYRLDSIPVQSCILLDSEEEARNFPRRPLELRFCDQCGLVFNSEFDLSMVDYASATEESQHFSGTFNRFALSLIDDIVENDDVAGARILEIGCGKGDFLQALVEKTGGRGLGIDPGFIPERIKTAGDQDIEFRKEYFDPDKIELVPDYVVCRHTLEHIPEVGYFMVDIARAMRGNSRAGIFFETPDVARVLDEGAFWDIYYEHCSYFTLGSHARLFRRMGFGISRLYLAYDGQYIIQHAQHRDTRPLPEENDLDRVRGLAARFPAQVDRMRSYWRDFVTEKSALGQSVAIWGGGSKGVSFLTTDGLDVHVDQVVDINPHKLGRYLPGTGLRVSSPEDLRQSPPDAVIVMNPVYRSEIAQQLGGMGITPDIYTPESIETGIVV